MSDTSTTTTTLLRELADLCLDSCVSPAGPIAVGFAIEATGDADNDAGNDVVLALKELDSVGELIGFDGPEHWDVFGVLATSATGPMVHLQHRDGEALTVVDDRVQTRTNGRIPDICRRVLGIATELAEWSSARFFAQVWLEQCVLFSLEHDNPSWHDLRDRCIFAPMCHDVATPTGLSVDRAFHALGRVLAERYPWPILRRAFADDGSLDDASWMDDGMFARELLAERLSVGTLLEDLESMVTHNVARAVRETLTAWEVDP